MNYIYKETITATKSYTIPETRIYRFHIVGRGGNGGTGGSASTTPPGGGGYSLSNSAFKYACAGGGGSGSTGAYSIHEVLLHAGDVIGISVTADATTTTLPNGHLITANAGKPGNVGGPAYISYASGTGLANGHLAGGGAGGAAPSASGGNILNLPGLAGATGSSATTTSPYPGKGADSKITTNALAIYACKSIAKGGVGSGSNQAGTVYGGDGDSAVINTKSLGGAAAGGGGGQYDANTKYKYSGHPGSGGAGGYGGVVIEVAANQPPTDPTDLFHITPNAGRPVAISWTASTDPDGDAIRYIVERRVDNNAFQQIANTGDTFYTDTCPSSGTYYQVRVMAVDSLGLESGYATGTSLPIHYNSLPEITGEDIDWGVLDQPRTYGYTPSDPDEDDILIVTEQVTNGENTIILRTFTATNGYEYTADLSGVWMTLAKGSHVLMITVSDGKGGEVTRTVAFNRDVHCIAASRVFLTEQPVKKCYLAMFPTDRPADAMLSLEVCNNPFDAEPAWEDISAIINRATHEFTNTSVINPGLGYRFRFIRGSEVVEVERINIKYGY